MKITAWLRKNIIPLVIGLALVVGLGLLGVAARLTGYWQGLLLNLGTEIIGAVATYFLFAWLIGRTETKAALIAQIRSSVKERAIAAIEELRQRGWLSDGSLRGANLDHVDLQGADLTGADLREASLKFADLQEATLKRANLRWADLWMANLREANLQWADLQEANLLVKLEGAKLRLANLQGARLQGAKLKGASLGDANLQGADLIGADLQGAVLFGANLRWADLSRAILQGADLSRAKLQGAKLRMANLQGAKFDKKYTILPDGAKWTPGTDMARFTDPKHPDFWCPEESS